MIWAHAHPCSQDAPRGELAVLERAWELEKSSPSSLPASSPAQAALRPACRITCRKCQVNHVHVTILFISILRLSDAFSTEPSGAQQSPLPPARDALLDYSPDKAASFPNTQCSFTLSSWAGNFFLASPWLSGQESTCRAGDTVDTGSIPGSGRSPEEGHGNPLQYSCLENPMDRGAWWATVHGGHKVLDTTERLTHTTL